jgi:hypothetical protein
MAITQVTLDDLEAAGRDAYEMFVAHNTRPRPWADIAEVARDRWRCVARRVLEHVVAK